MFVLSYSRIKYMGPQLLSAHIKGQKWEVRPFLTILTKNAKILQNWLYHPFLALYMGTKELRSHIFYSWIWNNKHRRIFFKLFFSKFLCTRYPGVPRGTTPRGKNPKMIFFCSNFFPNRFFGLIQEDWHQDCPFTIKNGWDIAIWSSGGTRGAQNFKPP